MYIYIYIYTHTCIHMLLNSLSEDKVSAQLKKPEEKKTSLKEILRRILHVRRADYKRTTRKVTLQAQDVGLAYLK